MKKANPMATFVGCIFILSLVVIVVVDVASVAYTTWHVLSKVW
jgi:hypothetical protein